jgi:hypothetical protein
MRKWFVVSFLSRTVLTVDAEDADTAKKLALDTVGKMVFSDALKGQTNDHVEIRTKNAEGVATAGFPEAADTIVLEITI